MEASVISGMDNSSIGVMRREEVGRRRISMCDRFKDFIEEHKTGIDFTKALYKCCIFWVENIAQIALGIILIRDGHPYWGLTQILISSINYIVAIGMVLFSGFCLGIMFGEIATDGDPEKDQAKFVKYALGCGGCVFCFGLGYFEQFIPWEKLKINYDYKDKQDKGIILAVQHELAKVENYLGFMLKIYIQFELEDTRFLTILVLGFNARHILLGLISKLKLFNNQMSKNWKIKGFAFALVSYNHFLYFLTWLAIALTGRFVCIGIFLIYAISMPGLAGGNKIELINTKDPGAGSSFDMTYADYTYITIFENLLAIFPDSLFLPHERLKDDIKYLWLVFLPWIGIIIYLSCFLVVTDLGEYPSFVLFTFILNVFSIVLYGAFMYIVVLLNEKPPIQVEPRREDEENKQENQEENKQENDQLNDEQNRRENDGLNDEEDDQLKDEEDDEENVGEKDEESEGENKEKNKNEN